MSRLRKRLKNKKLGKKARCNWAGAAQGGVGERFGVRACLMTTGESRGIGVLSAKQLSAS